MFVIGNLVGALAGIVDMLFNLLEIVIVVRVILSWANADPYNAFARAISAITEPMLYPFRKLLPPWRMGGWDLSPLFALLCLYFLRAFLVPTLYELSSRLHG